MKACLACAAIVWRYRAEDDWSLDIVLILYIQSACFLSSESLAHRNSDSLFKPSAYLVFKALLPWVTSWRGLLNAARGCIFPVRIMQASSSQCWPCCIRKALAQLGIMPWIPMPWWSVSCTQLSSSFPCHSPSYLLHVLDMLVKWDLLMLLISLW